MAGVVVLLMAGAMAFAIFEPIQVLPRIRLAPGYALVDQTGATVTSEDGRGALTLYSFAPVDCGVRCADMHRTMREVGDRVEAEVDLGDVDFRLVTVALQPLSDTAAGGSEVQRLADAAAAAGADDRPWLWLGGDEVTIRNVVGSGFGRWYEVDDDGEAQFDPGFVLVDGNGVIRGDYRYQTLADDADKLTRHLAILGQELRHQGPASALAYEAAHLFLCYP